MPKDSNEVKLVDDNSGDEAVNGPEIVAKILNQMAPSQRERLLKSIKTASPETAIKIQDALISFDDIAELTPQGVQTLLKKVDANDLTLSLAAASPEVKETILSNLSSRRQEMLLSELEGVKAASRVDVEEAQRRVLKTLEELKTAGAVRDGETRGKAKHDVWI